MLGVQKNDRFVEPDVIGLGTEVLRSLATGRVRVLGSNWEALRL
jgi:hypothetical protein